MRIKVTLPRSNVSGWTLRYKVVKKVPDSIKLANISDPFLELEGPYHEEGYTLEMEPGTLLVRWNPLQSGSGECRCLRVSPDGSLMVVGEEVRSFKALFEEVRQALHKQCRFPKKSMDTFIEENRLRLVPLDKDHSELLETYTIQGEHGKNIKVRYTSRVFQEPSLKTLLVYIQKKFKEVEKGHTKWVKEHRPPFPPAFSATDISILFYEERKLSHQVQEFLGHDSEAIADFLYNVE